MAKKREENLKKQKMKEIEEGEKNTSYFLGLEKSRGNYNSIQKISTENNEITSQEDIMCHLKNHSVTNANVLLRDV